MNRNVRKLVFCGVFIALIFAATYFTKIPLPGAGYFNAGDCMIILGSAVLGPVWGAVCAGVGSALSDLIAGYGVYVPITLVVKALMGVAIGLILKKKTLPRGIISAFVSEIIMVLGYFLAETFVFDAATATAGVLGNLVQGGVSVVLGIVLLAIVTKNTAIKTYISKI